MHRLQVLQSEALHQPVFRIQALVSLRPKHDLGLNGESMFGTKGLDLRLLHFQFHFCLPEALGHAWFAKEVLFLSGWAFLRPLQQKHK